MERKMIRLADFNTNIFDIFSRRWMLLTAGDFETGKFNTMTIGWGMMGTFWSKPMVMVGVRPQRYTREFMDDYPTFTLSVFPESYQEKLAYCGAHSGRDGDKIKECKLTPVRSEYVEAPTFAEAELSLECRSLYAQPLMAKCLMEKMLMKKLYPEHDLHKIYLAEVKAITATEAYRTEL